MQLAGMKELRGRQSAAGRTTAAASSEAPTEEAPSAAGPGTPLLPECSALVVGGGPAGLAAALQLSKRGWRDVVVLERRDSVEYADTDRSYVYNIDGRGRRLMQHHGLMGGLEREGVSTAVVDLLRVYPDGRKEQRQQAIKDPTRATHWLPRPAFVGLLAAALRDEPHASNVRVVTGAAVVAIRRPSSGGGGLEVDVELSSGAAAAPATLRPRLLLGCDGAASAVRGALQGWAAGDAELAAAGGSFSTVEVLPCPSSGLKFKVLPLPANPVLKDGTSLTNSSFVLLQGGTSKALGSRHDAIRLGLLPFKDPGAPRTANLITKPGHPVWDVTDAEGMYKVLEEALPQADWRALVPADTMGRFAASRGGAFPAPAHSDGAAAFVDGTAVMLLGDSLHCFPPDLGQGVNSALLDVLALDEALASSSKAAGDGAGRQPEGPGAVDLAAAAAEFQRRQLPQAVSLCNLLPIGFPLQYFASWQRNVWNFIFLMQLALSKVAPWLMPPPTFMMVQDSGLDYATIFQRAQRAQRVGRTLLAIAAASVALTLMRLVLRGAAGAA